MAIEYNPNKGRIFNDYIDSAVTNLKSVQIMLGDIFEHATFPSKTIIGRRFDKKSVIKSCYNSVVVRV